MRPGRALPLRALLLNDPRASVAKLMLAEPVMFDATNSAGDAALAFKRYDLVSAPVVNERGKLLGRLTVDAVMDYIRSGNQTTALVVRDPALGSSVLLTFITDGMGFFIFLGLATVFPL